jgi:hypothetical protein
MDSPAKDTPALPHFQPAAITTTADLHTVQSLSPDRRALSILFTRLELRVSDKDAEPGAARAVQVAVPIENARSDPQAAVTVTVRGQLDATEDSGSACTVIVGDQVKSSAGSQGSFEIEMSFQPGTTTMSWNRAIVLACTRGIGLPGEAMATVESIDLAFQPEQKSASP